MDVQAQHLQTFAVGEDSQAVDEVGVAVIDLHTFARHQPSSDAGVVAAGEELRAADHCQAADTVLVTYSGR